jgi:uncharacterized tellurite resistance protein B-like protein
MLNKEFYITYGKVLYALAKSDGYIQEIEQKKIIELIHDKLVLAEQQNDFIGTDLAYYTAFAFEAAEDFELTLEDALLEFTAHFKLHHLHIDEFQKELLVDVLDEVATSYGNLSKKEIEIIEKFKMLIEGEI